MRVQLQEQTGGKTVHHHSTTLPARSGGVRVKDLVKALTALRTQSAITKSLGKSADAALQRATTWATSRPPGGVSGQHNWSFPFDPHKPRGSFRFDIENIVGNNLRQS